MAFVPPRSVTLGSEQKTAPFIKQLEGFPARNAQHIATQKLSPNDGPGFDLFRYRKERRAYHVSHLIDSCETWEMMRQDGDDRIPKLMMQRFPSMRAVLLQAGNDFSRVHTN